MAKKIRRHLKYAELKVLKALFCEAIRYVAKLKKDGVGRFIQFPKVPPILTESLVMECARALFPRGHSFALGGIADISFVEGRLKSAKVKTVEVKASQAGFQHFSPKDINSDYLVWLDCALLRASGLIKMHVLPTPAKSGFRVGRITLKKFLASAGGELRQYQGSFTAFANGKLGKQIKRGSKTWR